MTTQARALALCAALSLGCAGCGGGTGAATEVAIEVLEATEAEPQAEALAELEFAAADAVDAAEAAAEPAPDTAVEAEPVPEAVPEAGEVVFPLSVELELKSSACQAGPLGVTVLHVSLAWTTSLPARSTLEVALNEASGQGDVEVAEEYGLEHALELDVTPLLLPAVPKPGDAILLVVHAQGQHGESGSSAPLGIAVDAALAACLYPFDPDCSDGAKVMCREAPPVCDAGLVLAADAGCYRCLYPATCSCDDGQLALPDCPEPGECGALGVLATQQGCPVCVDPMTCRPFDAR
jgi:hypothetical protein